MLTKSAGIVLHTLPYKESSVISHMYTREFGRLSMITSGVRKRKPIFHPNLFQPLSLVDIVFYFKEKNEIHRIKDIKHAVVFREIPYHIEKNCIALFLAELLYKVIREQDRNENLFEFLSHGIEILDHLQNGIANFHLIFLMQLSKYIGFYPTNNFSDLNCYFNVSKGKYYPIDSNDNLSLSKEVSHYWQLLLRTPLNAPEVIGLPAVYRHKLIQAILDYYTLHFGHLGAIKSFEVLHQVFH